MVESTLLFDSSTRPWDTTSIRELQSMVDKRYRSVWNNGRGLPLKRMQEEHVNMYGVRRELEIVGVRTKIEKRALERVGHILRMPDKRMVKRVVLGQWDEPTKEGGKLRGGTIAYWRRLASEAGVDWTNLENLTQDRKRWRKTIAERVQHLQEWEDKMSLSARGEPKPLRSQRGENSDETSFICRWKGCGRVCATAGGRVQHERRIHRKATAIFSCRTCNRTFNERSLLTNHSKTCTGSEKAECEKCGKEMMKTSLRVHKQKHCKPPRRDEASQSDCTEAKRVKRDDSREKTTKETKVPCEVCGKAITRSNIARHRRRWHPCQAPKA